MGSTDVLSVKERRKRKMLAMMPLMVLPFLTLAFYALGGGRKNETDSKQEATGLNFRLPGSQLKAPKEAGKLAFYEQAARDSERLAEFRRMDPYAQSVDTLEQEILGDSLRGIERSWNSADARRLSNTKFSADPSPEAPVLQQLAQLQRELNQPFSSAATANGSDAYSRPEAGQEDLDRLEQMMGKMHSGGEQDPELTQLSKVMDKILQAQQPSIDSQTSTKKQELPQDFHLVNAVQYADSTVQGFWGTSISLASDSGNAIEAVIAETQIIQPGSMLRILLAQDVFIGQEKIPAGTTVVGVCELQEDRLEVIVRSIRKGSSLFAVRLEVYDLDGMAGIYIPGAHGPQTLMQGADRSISALDMSASGNAILSRLAQGGMQSVRGLLSQRTRVIKVEVNSGHRILLLNKPIG